MVFLCENGSSRLLELSLFCGSRPVVPAYHDALWRSYSAKSSAFSCSLVGATRIIGLKCQIDPLRWLLHLLYSECSILNYQRLNWCRLGGLRDTTSTLLRSHGVPYNINLYCMAFESMNNLFEVFFILIFLFLARLELICDRRRKKTAVGVIKLEVFDCVTISPWQTVL